MTHPWSANCLRQHEKPLLAGGPGMPDAIPVEGPRRRSPRPANPALWAWKAAEYAAGPSP